MTRNWMLLAAFGLLLGLFVYLFRFEYVPLSPRAVYRINRITGHIDILVGVRVVPMRTEGGGKSKPETEVPIP